MRLISTTLAAVVCIFAFSLAHAGDNSGEVQATCNSATGQCGIAPIARVRTAVRQQVVGTLAKISQASASCGGQVSCSGQTVQASCGQVVQSCGQVVQSCGQVVQSCGQVVQSCGQAVQSCEAQVNACESGTFGCGAKEPSCGAGLGQAMVSYRNSNDDIAYAKSLQQAQSGRMRHVGGSMGSGHYEGVGMSSISGEDAIRRACYYGQRQIVGKSFVQGSNGMFYATVLYN